MRAILLCCSLLYSCKSMSSLSKKLAVTVALAGRRAPVSTCLHHPCRGYRHTAMLVFYLGAGDPYSDLHTCRASYLTHGVIFSAPAPFLHRELQRDSISQRWVHWFPQRLRFWLSWEETSSTDISPISTWLSCFCLIVTSLTSLKGDGFMQLIISESFGFFLPHPGLFVCWQGQATGKLPG